MTHIAIIGAGLSGRLLALNLLRQASPPVHIQMVDRGGERSMGPAYSNEADDFLLNVPANRMGAFPQDPEHFLKWAQGKAVQAGPWDFLPRRLYREYVFDLLHQAQQERPDGPAFEFVSAEVTDIEIEQGCAVINVRGMAAFTADKAVLALGNFPPRHPQIQNRAALTSRRYARVPWTPGILDRLERYATVFLIGTGQTTVDLLAALQRGGHEGRIIAISRRGFLPLPHRGFETYPSFYEEIKDAEQILEVFKTVRKHLHRAEGLGIDPRSVIDSLRPHTQGLWLGLPDVEKRRFVRHLFRYWEIIRSRIPPESQAVIEGMRASGQLEIVAGRLRDMVERQDAMEVTYTPSGQRAEQTVQAALVINTTGPESNYELVEHPLVTNLMRRGLVRPGPARLGLDAQPNGAVIGRGGAESCVLYTLGSPMKGVLWEVIAAPEIRLQAERLAGLLLRTGAASECS